MKKSCINLLALIAATVLLTGFTTTKLDNDSSINNNKEKQVINVWTFTDEVQTLVQTYFQAHPDLDYELNFKILSYNDGSYQKALDEALKNPDKNSPDIYAVELSFAQKYTKGAMQDYAMPYSDLGFNIKSLANKNRIPKYTLDIGSNTKNEVNALCYQTSGGVFIYRRSIAKEVFGTDDPAKINKIIGASTGSWDNFLKAAEKLEKSGYKIVSGIEDVWTAYQGNSKKGWIVDGKLYIDPKREKFMEDAKKLIKNNWTNNANLWSDEWYFGMNGYSKAPVFGYFGPSWFINYTLDVNSNYQNEGTYGDWATCLAPNGFIWGGTWILVNKNLSKEKKSIVKELINYITLDTSNNGILYKWASGELTNGFRDTVASGTLMHKTHYEHPLLGNQNLFEYLETADSMASGTNITDYDTAINSCWLKYVQEYAQDRMSLTDALESFKSEAQIIIQQ